MRGKKFGKKFVSGILDNLVKEPRVTLYIITLTRCQRLSSQRDGPLHRALSFGGTIPGEAIQTPNTS